MEEGGRARVKGMVTMLSLLGILHMWDSTRERPFEIIQPKGQTEASKEKSKGRWKCGILSIDFLEHLLELSFSSPDNYFNVQLKISFT